MTLLLGGGGGDAVLCHVKWLSASLPSALVAQMVSNLSTMQEIPVQSLGREDLLEKGMFLPGESHGQQSLVGYNPCGHKRSNTTEGVSFYLCICLLPNRCQHHLPCAALPPPHPALPKVVRLKEMSPDSAKWQNFAKGQNHSSLWDPWPWRH